MANSFLEFLESMSIATEADDITTQTANDVRSAIGGTPSTQSDADTRGDEEDLEKVDDIFGTETPDNAPSAPTADDNMDTPAEEDDPENTEDMPSGDGETPEGETDPNLEGGEDPTTDDQSPNDDLVFTKKNRIRDNLVQLYTIITGDIDIVVNSLTNINDSNTIQVMNSVINHLRNCKSYIYKTLTEELMSLEYDELLQRYLTLKRVYDICIEMMEQHFKKEDKKEKK